MPNLTITVTAQQATRIQTALGRIALPSEPNPGQWIPATTQEVLDFMKNQLKAKVVAYEANQAANTVQQTVSAETW